MAGTLINVATSGNIVVPLVDIIERLKGKLDQAEIENLLFALISKQQERVHPGDLITADLMNQVLAQLANIQVRLAKLEAGGVVAGVKPVIIDDISPDPQKAGQILTVTGSNFPKQPEKDGNVTLGDIPIERFQSATETQLLFSVPTALRAPDDFDLTVRNGTASDTRSVHILARGSNLRGKVLVTTQTPRLSQIKVGKTYTIDFKVDSQTNIAERYTIEPTYTEVDGDATELDWLDNTKLTDLDTGSSLAEAVEIEDGSPLNVRLQVKIPEGAGSAKLALSAKSNTLPTNTGLNQVSNPAMVLKVGETVVTSDPRATFKILDLSTTANARKADIDGVPGIEVMAGKEEFIVVTGTLTPKGQYAFTAKLDLAGDGWTASDPDPAETFKNAANGSEDIAVTVKAGPATSPKRTLTIKTVHERDDAEPKFESWIEIPIRAFKP